MLKPSRHGSDTSSVRLAVATDGADDAGHNQAAALAKRLRLPFLESAGHESDSAHLVLVRTASRFELRDLSERRARPVFVDFIGGATGFRRRSGLSGNQPIARAVGIRCGTRTVLDATAGLARDAFMLACLGCHVLAVERSPILAALVEDGLRRARRDGSPELRRVIERITFVHADAREVLTETTSADAPDAIYLDPMYPTKTKAALPKKEMRLCRLLVGDDADAGELLVIARRVAKRRVTVKRHRLAPPLGAEPDTCYLSKQVRYDVYLTPAASDA